MPHSVVESLDHRILPLYSGQEDRIGKVVAFGKRHRFGPVQPMRRMEITHHRSRLVFSHTEAQRQQVLDWVGAPSADSGGQHAENSAFGGGEFCSAHRESGFDAPGLQWAREPQEQYCHRLLRGWKA